MINSKNLGKITFALIVLSLIAVVGFAYLENVGIGSETAEYIDKLFGEGVLEIDIEVDGADWQKVLDNPQAKEYIPGNLIINGTKFNSVGIRTKGNSSLFQVAQMPDSDRYSLQFKANYYVKGQSFFGLDSFCVNNVISDFTYMKDTMSYDVMAFIGVDAPLTNYAKVTVNGEDVGFYIAIERYNKSFLGRVYNRLGGQLYNVKMAMGFGVDLGQGGDRQNRGAGPDARGGMDPRQMFGGDLPFGDMPFGDMPFGDVPPDLFGEEGFGGPPGMAPADMDFDMGGFGGMGSGGGSLIYTDDNISSYPSIFDNVEFRKKNSLKDKERVITAIKNINEGNELEKYLDVDKTLRYLAAHTVVVNLDSYSTNMAQNYYLYERDGKLTILPWDYNLAFGGFQSGNPNEIINFPIDTPVSGVNMEDRPLINELLKVEEYKERYHAYLQEIVDDYFMSGLYAETILALDEKIGDYVKADTTSFSGYEKYVASLPILIEFGQLRAESINGQLNGSIPSTTEGQRANKDSLIDASHLNVAALGTMMNMGAGGEQGGFPGAPGGFSPNRDFSDERAPQEREVFGDRRPPQAMEVFGDIQPPRGNESGGDTRNFPDFNMGNQNNVRGSALKNNKEVIFSLLLLGVALLFMFRVKKRY